MTDAIPIPKLHEIIDEAAAFGFIKVVVFTGGECFLLGDDLDRLIERATRHKLLTRFVSNGYWASTREIAARRVKSLVAAGLVDANFSTGQFHSKYVPVSRVRNGAVACAEAGLNTLVMVEVEDQTTFDFNKFVEEDPDFARLVSEGSIQVKASPWMDFGDARAKTNHNDSYQQMATQMAASCDTVLDVISVTPKGNVYACCGLPMESIPELVVGNIYKQTLTEILNQSADDFIKIWIHMEGPGGIVEYAKRIDPSLDIDPHMGAHVCSVCREMYTNSRLQEIIINNPPPNREAIINAYKTKLLLKSLYNRQADDCKKIRKPESNHMDFQRRFFDLGSGRKSEGSCSQKLLN